MKNSDKKQYDFAMCMYALYMQQAYGVESGKTNVSYEDIRPIKQLLDWEKNEGVLQKINYC